MWGASFQLAWVGRVSNLPACTVDIVGKLVIVALAVALIWALCQPRSVFAIGIKNRKARRIKGPVPAAFLEEVESICGEGPELSGTIRAVAQRKGIRLVFSPGIPQTVRQKLRNAWCLHH
jgi:Protein of unknown function (DUF3634)